MRLVCKWCGKLRFRETCYSCMKNFKENFEALPYHVMGKISLWTHEDYINWTVTLDHEKRLDMYVLGLNEEAGEVAGKLKKLYRDLGGNSSDPKWRKAFLLEMGDVFYYFSRILQTMNATLGEVNTLTYEKLEGRRERNTIKGSGDDR